jgi:hypothetical protein
MSRKEQGWIAFQTSDKERQLLEQVCQRSQRSKTEVLRELLRGLGQDPAAAPAPPPPPQKAKKVTEPVLEKRAAPKKPLKVSSRNVLKGKVVKVVSGSVNTEVTLEIVHKVILNLNYYQSFC